MARANPEATTARRSSTEDSVQENLQPFHSNLDVIASWLSQNREVPCLTIACGVALRSSALPFEEAMSTLYCDLQIHWQVEEVKADELGKRLG